MSKRTAESNASQGTFPPGIGEKLYSDCVALFSALCHEPASELCQSNDSSSKEALGRLYLWGEGFRDGQLDVILATSPYLRVTVLKLLAKVGGLLRTKYSIADDPSDNSTLHALKDGLGISIGKAWNIISECLKQEAKGNEKDDVDSDGSNSTEDDIVGELQFHIRLLMSLVPSMEKAFKHAIQEQQRGQMASSIAGAMRPTLSRRRERNSLRSGRSQETAQDESAAPVADQPQATPTTTHEYESLQSISDLAVRPPETKGSGSSPCDPVDQPFQHRRIQDADSLPRRTRPAVISHAPILSGENQKGPIPGSRGPIEPEHRSRTSFSSTLGSSVDVDGSAQDLQKQFQMLLSSRRQNIFDPTCSRDESDEAIRKAEQAVEAINEGHPTQATILSSLGSALLSRYDQTGRRDYLKKAITNTQRAVDITLQDLAGMLSNLSNTLFRRYEQTGKTEDLEEAIANSQRAVNITPQDHSGLAALLSNLSNMLFRRYERTGKIKDLEEAITNAQRAVDITPQDHPDLAITLNTLGNILFRRYEQTGKTEDLEEAIANTQRAVDITPQDHPDLASMLNSLSSTLVRRYVRIGKTEDLEEAIINAQRAADITPQDHPRLVAKLNNLSSMLFRRYERTGKTEDLEEAITNARRAVDITPQDHSDLATPLNTLGNILLSRYKRTGNIKDLEEAITNAQRAVDIIPQDHPDLAGWLNNLSGMLFRRYERTGKTEDLEEAITKARRAVDTTPQDHSDLATLLNTLGSILASRYERTGKTEDLEEAITNAQRAVDITPQDHPDLAGRLSNLSNALVSRYERTGKTEDLEEAITNARRAVDITPQDHSDLATLLNTLGSILASRYERTGKTEDLEEAITNAQRAADITPQDHPDLASWLNNLGSMLFSRYKWTQNANDRDAALNCYLKSSECHGAIPLKRITAARQAIRLLAEQNNWQKASSLAHEAVNLLPMVCSRYLSREDQQHAVLQTSGLAADACSLSLRTDNDPDRALEYLEHGRGLILGYLIDGRGDISELKKDSPEKAEEFDRLRFKAVMPIRTDELPDIRQQLLREREEAARDLENCLRDIRQLPGHKRFFLPPSSDVLKGYAADGPIVVVNVTNISSDALIVLTSGIKVVRLPELHESKIDQYRPWSLTRCATRDAKLVREQKDDNTFRDFLARLWSDCVRLVLDELGFSKPSINLELPRIWWIGTGLAGSLPFHAAGDHSASSVENTLSYAISSYTPTIKALRHSREKARIEFDKHSVLLVTMPKTPGRDDLPGVESEEKAICDAVKNPHSVQPLIQPSADTVLDKLRDCSIVHFACHGSSDLMDPSDSFLALQGNSNSIPDKLTVQKIFDANLGQAWLAYLSACSTAENKVAKLTDEALHLASSFQIAGFGHVVASMWPSNDAICAQVASIFYQDLMMRGGIRGGSRAVAAALHAAVREVRSQNIDQPYLWAQYIHLGA